MARQRDNAPFLVKRLAPMIGAAWEAPRRVTTAVHAYTLDEAMATARHRMRNTTFLGWHKVYWIERRGQPATRRRSA